MTNPENAGSWVPKSPLNTKPWGVGGCPCRHLILESSLSLLQVAQITEQATTSRQAPELPITRTSARPAALRTAGQSADLSRNRRYAQVGAVG
jgi:hypothetical protein